MMGIPELPHVESVGRKGGIVGIAALGSFLVRESLKRFVTQGTQKVRKLLGEEDGQPKSEA